MKKFFKHIKLFLKMKFGKPNEFAFVGQTEGKPVGAEFKVVHLTFYDMAEWACRCRLTEEVILNNIKADAIRITDFERLDDYNGFSTLSRKNLT